MKIKPGNKKYYIVIVLIIILLSGSCATTKYVPEGERLLSKVEISNSVGNTSKQELKSYVRQQENLKILGFWKLYLGVYNLSGRNENKKINKWLRKIGEEPVIFDSTLVDRSVSQLTLYLNNRGYFQANVTDSIYYPSRKKAKVFYEIDAGPRYQIKNVSYRIEDENIEPLILKDTANTFLRQGRSFTVEWHERERERITRNLNNRGYFAFTKEYIYFNADSSHANYLISDTVVVTKPLKQLQTDSEYHEKYSIRHVLFVVGGEPQDIMMDGISANQYRDTVYYQGFKIIYNNKLGFKPNVLINSNNIYPGDLYRIELVERTQQLLTSLRIFRYINIRFREIDDSFDSNGNKQVDCIIHVIQGELISHNFDLEGTNSSGSIGAGGSFKFQHKNIFKGAELLGLSARIARQDQFISSSTEFFNTMEAGGEASITFPKFFLPFKIEKFRQRYNPYTSLSFSYSYQRRPDYTRSIVTGRMGYSWRSSRFTYHNFSLFDFSVVNVPKISDNFKNMIESTFLHYIYQDHLILNINYTITYNQQVLGRNTNFWFVRYNVESAGNTLGLLVPLSSKPQEEDYYTLFGIRYAQYVKNDIDISYHKRINRFTSVTYRLYTGVAIPYGNLDILPFEKRFFSGGAFSLRAWPVRGIGPGNVRRNTVNFYNQTADIKLEGNIEYRFKLFWILEGAFFVDAGNIWDIRKRNARETGLFKFDEFYKQIAVGTGFGVRFDFNFFVLRLDTGIKIHDPSLIKDKRWRPLSGYTGNDFALNIAIGYPF